MLLRNKFPFLLWIFLLFISCTGDDVQQQKINKKELNEKLIRANKQFVKNQLEDIDGYIERKGLKMDTTATGLRYFITGRTKGKFPAKRNNVTIKYITSLLDGVECYRSDSLGNLTFNMTYADVPGGLLEAVSMMTVGSRALIIMPSHLAYGLTGDHNKIPSNAAVVMQVEVIKIE